MHKYLKPNTNEVASKVVDGEAILINLSNGMYFSLDAVGGSIWTLVSDGHDLNTISTAVAQHYGVAEDTVANDIQTFAQTLVEEGLVVSSDSEAPAGQPAPKLTPATGDYATPQLTKFDDMVDLFALDPPLPELSRVGD